LTISHMSCYCVGCHIRCCSEVASLQSVRVYKKRRVLGGFWTWVVTRPHLCCTNVVVNVCSDSPHELLLCWVPYQWLLGSCYPPKFLLTVYSGIAPITCSCSRSLVFQLDAPCFTNI